MWFRVRMILLAACAFLGMLLTVGNITGQVVSQTCCTGDDCAAENYCSVLQQPVSNDQYLGPAILLASLLVGFTELHNAKPQEGKITKVV